MDTETPEVSGNTDSRRFPLKRQLIFISIMMLTGALAACLVITVLGAIAVPAFNNYPLTLAEHADYDRMNRIFGPLAENADPLLVMVLIITLFALITLLAALNQNLHLRKIRGAKAAGKATLILLAALIMMVIDIVLSEAGFGAVPLLLLYLPAAAGLVWLLAGESGWAGDLSSWRSQPTASDPGVPATLILGVLWGLTAGLIVVFCSQFLFGKFFIVVSEVLDGTGETSFKGFLWFFAGGAVLMSLAGGILMGLAFALAPAPIAREQRQKLLIAPGILSLILLLVSGGGYLYAVANYDLGADSLVEAAGLPDTRPRTLTVVNLSFQGTSEQNAWEWPLQAETWGFAYSDTITISPDNLDKLDEFLTRKRGRSVFQYNAMDTLIKGALVLFDTDTAGKKISDFSRDLLLPRMIQLHRLRSQPVTGENREILLGYTDEELWHIPGNAALRLSRAFDHFGMVEEARRWFERAVDSGQDPEGFQPAATPLPTDGSISGSLNIQGIEPGKVVVGLMNASRVLDEKPTPMDLQMDLLTSTTPKEDGTFTFFHLGRGEYKLLALLPKEIVPASVTIVGGTGVIRLDGDGTAVELGTIEVGW